MANAALLLDYLFVGELLKQRLQAEVSGITVEGIESLSQAVEANVRTNIVYVLWDGDTFGAGSAQSASASSQIVTQRWTLLFALRDARQHVQDAHNTSAGPMLSALHKAVAGWIPEGAFRPFKRINGRQPTYRANVGLYPLTFSIDLNL
jgi:hypothetical protein